MRRVQVVHQLRRDGSGVLWVHARHGWRRITFARGGLLSALSALGGATTAPLAAPRPVPQVMPCLAVPLALVPRAGPCQPIAAQAP